MSAYPSLQPEDRSPFFGEPIVAPPTARSAASCPVTGRSSDSGNSAISPRRRLESFQARRRDLYPAFPAQSNPRKLRSHLLPNPALGGIQLQPQVLLNPVPDRFERCLRRCL